MSHITLAQQGLAAAEARNWDEAVAKLSPALKESQNPAWLVARSKAFVGLKRFQDALDDANLAWHKAYERSKRPLLLEAQYRRAVAYYRLKQYANADACCIYSMRLAKGFPAVEKDDPAAKLRTQDGFYTATLDDAKKEAQADEMNASKNPGQAMGMESGPENQTEWRRASTLRTQILYEMEKLPEDDPARKLTATLKPDQKELGHVEKPAAPKPAAPAVPSDAPVRLQDFQSDKTMSVSIFSKGNDKTLQVQYMERAVILDPLVYPNGDKKPFRLDLWGEIDAAASKHTVTANKVELSLAKKVPGKWAQLKGEPDQAPLPVRPAAQPAQPDQPEALSYPTSSRNGPKNWDKLGDDDENDGPDVNLFFKQLYKNATPEQQRAMMKSFTESNGTSLSTDWGDVKDRTVETVPPEGVEAKSWKQ